MDDILLTFLKAKLPVWSLLIVAGLFVLFEGVLRLPKFLDAVGDLRDRGRLRHQKKVLEYILDVVVRHYDGYRSGGGGMSDSGFYWDRSGLHDEAVRLGYLASKGSQTFTRTDKPYPQTPRELREAARDVNPELEVPKKLTVGRVRYAENEPRIIQIPDTAVAAEGKQRRLKSR